MNQIFSADSAPSFPGSTSPDAFAREPGYLAYQEELRSLILNTAQTAPPTPEAVPVPETDVLPNKEDLAAQAETRAVLANPQLLKYLKNYVAEVAPWLDMFDSQAFFTVQVPILARRCPALLYAILALSARQVERKESRRHSFDSLELYQEAIRRVNPLLQAHDIMVVPICVILCCLEMMSASPRDWRRHLEGCVALFEAFGVNGFRSGMLQAVFWCYARMDLCGALISDGTEGTLIPASEWLPSDAIGKSALELFQEHRSSDMHANYAVYLGSKVCKLIADRTRYTELDEKNGCDAESFQVRWLHLWNELQTWVHDRPQELVPVHSIESQPFPQILFVHWAGISSSQLYHTACIILLGTKPREIKLDSGSGFIASPTWHAKRICGISLTNPHPGCLNNAIQPLWVAGRLLSHKSEHAVLLKLIGRIESMTGWATSWRIADLETAWGYKVN